MQMYLAYLILLTVQAILFSRNMPVPCSEGGRIVIKKKDGTRFFLMLSCIELIIFAGLRGHTIGADTVLYLDALKHYTGISLAEVFTAPLVYPFDFEIGYFILTKLCGFLHFSPTAFLFVLSILIYVPLFKYIYRNSSHPYISVLTYFAFGFLSYSLGIFRQFIAIGIILSALRFIEERKFWKYLIAVLFAMLFHLTAFIALPLYFLVKINWEKHFFIVVTMICEVILLIVGRSVIMLAVMLFPSYAGYIGGYYDLQGGSYLNLIFLNMVMLLFFYTNRHIPEKKDIKYNLVFAQLVIAILLQCCAYHMAIFGRIVPYFSISLLVAIPTIIDRLSRNDRALSLILKVGTCAVLVILTVQDLYQNGYVYPFYFFWEAIPK